MIPHTSFLEMLSQANRSPLCLAELVHRGTEAGGRCAELAELVQRSLSHAIEARRAARKGSVVVHGQTAYDARRWMRSNAVQAITLARCLRGLLAIHTVRSTALELAAA